MAVSFPSRLKFSQPSAAAAGFVIRQVRSGLSHFILFKTLGMRMAITEIGAVVLVEPLHQSQNRSTTLLCHISYYLGAEIWRRVGTL